MKRIACVALALLLLALCGCTTHVNRNSTVELVFTCNETSFRQTLPAEEAQRVAAILDGKVYDPPSGGIPSCGYSLDVAIVIGLNRYCLAMDTCNGIYDVAAFRYFSVPDEDLEYLHGLFEKYGGYFPCV